MRAEDIITNKMKNDRPEWEKRKIEHLHDRIKNMYLKEVSHLRHLAKK